jgi:hypothetical protein
VDSAARIQALLFSLTTAAAGFDIPAEFFLLPAYARARLRFQHAQPSPARFVLACFLLPLATSIQSPTQNYFVTELLYQAISFPTGQAPVRTSGAPVQGMFFILGFLFLCLSYRSEVLQFSALLVCSPSTS